MTSAEQQSTQEAKETRKDDDNDEHKAALILAYGDGLSAGYVGMTKHHSFAFAIVGLYVIITDHIHSYNSDGAGYKVGGKKF